MGRSPYQSEKRRKELARLKKQEEKRQRRFNKKHGQDTPEGQTGETATEGGMATESGMTTEGGIATDAQPEGPAQGGTGNGAPAGDQESGQPS